MSKITRKRWKAGKVVSLKRFSDANAKHLNYYLVSTLAKKRSQTMAIFIPTISSKVTSNPHVNFRKFRTGSYRCWFEVQDVRSF